MGGVGEDGAAGDGVVEPRVVGEQGLGVWLLPQGEVQGGELAAELDVFDGDDGGAWGGAAWEGELGGEGVWLAGLEVCAGDGEDAGGCVAAVGDYLFYD